MIRFGLGCAALLVPAILVGQTPPARPAPASSARVAPLSPSYRGFTPGRSYQEFAERARTLASRDTLRCNTSRNTAQLMECGEWARRDLTRRFGPSHRRQRSMLEWVSGRRVVRLNWRGRGTARWISITLRDDDVMDGIARYVRRPAPSPARRN